MEAETRERWFEIEAPEPNIKSIVIGTELRGFRIYIHGNNLDERFQGSDTVQDRPTDMIRILRKCVPSESVWFDCESRDRVHVWDALSALLDFEEAK